MPANPPHERRVGDTGVAFSGVMRYRGSYGVSQIRNLTAATVTFTMINAATGVVKVNAAAATISDIPGGVAYYAFVADDVDTAGIYWGTFEVTQGGKTYSYPAAPRDGVIWIHSTTLTARQAYDAELSV